MIEPYRCTRIRVGNLAVALNIAIKEREKWEKEQQPITYSAPSALLQGWKDCLEAIKEGEIPEVTR